MLVIWSHIFLQLVAEDLATDEQFFYYPSSFIFTPGRELVQRIIFKEEQKAVRSQHSYFGYPFSQASVDSLLKVKC